MKHPTKVALVTNIPSPYRVPVFDLVKDVDLTVIYSAKLENNRLWKFRPPIHQHLVLSENKKELSDGFNYIHNNPDVWQHLRRLNPDIVVTTGFNPTHVYAYMWAIMHRRKHICMTDGTVLSESGLSVIHKLARRFFFAGSSAFLAPSNGGISLYRSYGISSKKIFRSHLCANNDLFFGTASSKSRSYDVMFSGQLHERKLPFLFVEVCKRLLSVKHNLRVLLIGDGPLRNEVLDCLKQAEIDFHYAGFVQQEDLPKYYGNSKVLLFTTRMDPWGVVANEAMAAGTPVITTPYAGVAGELVIDGVTGAVCEPDPEVWAKAVSRLLDDQQYWTSCSVNARRQVEGYNYKAAAEGIEAACRFALGRR